MQWDLKKVTQLFFVYPTDLQLASSVKHNWMEFTFVPIHWYNGSKKPSLIIAVIRHDSVKQFRRLVKQLILHEMQVFVQFRKYSVSFYAKYKSAQFLAILASIMQQIIPISSNSCQLQQMLESTNADLAIISMITSKATLFVWLNSYP